ncbi:MAG: QueT transporter family protein, partial [Firmicutes bacterium]|nr:QueT transporter family protein [Bacillota bacterium]
MGGKILDTKKLVRAALIAAIYVLLVYLFAGVSFGIFQFRPAEALTLLPMLYPEAVPAIFVGVLLSNILGGLGPWDIFGG